MAIDTIRRGVDYLFGQTNAQQLKRMEHELGEVNALEKDVSGLTDQELRNKTDEFRDRLAAGESKREIRAEAYAVVREVAKRTVGMQPFDVQILGAIALDDRKIAEMQTGEGKTLVATLPAYLNALVGKVRGGHHLRYKQPVRVRLPPRQHGPVGRSEGAGAARFCHRR